jgi:hypothetical protein
MSGERGKEWITRDIEFMSAKTDRSCERGSDMLNANVYLI